MSLELNKIAASVLTAGVVAMGAGFVADILIHPHVPEEPVYQVAMAEDSGGGGEEASEPAGPESVLPLLADADAAAGEQATRACAACHSFEKGGANKVGPNLYGVVGNEIASHDGFSYSSGLSEKEGAWTYEKLAAFLHDPKGWAPGTNMSYPGIKDVQERADVIAYLRENDDDPEPLPTEEEIAEVTGGGESEGSETDGGESGAGDSGEGDSGEGDSASTESGGETQTAEESGSGDGEASGDGSESGESDGGDELTARLADASAADGEKASRVCMACHSFEQGGPNKLGPNLYNTVGKDIASHEGFNTYSDVLKGKDGEWTYAKLDAFLENPQGWASGTRMTYAGIKDPAKRADVIKYLAEQSENPPAIE